MSWLPLLPEAEVAAIKPFRKQLKRERRLAFAELTDTLRSQRYLKLLSRLQVWIKAPVGTAMAAEPVRDWLPELQGQLIGDLFLLPGGRFEASEPGSYHHELQAPENAPLRPGPFPSGRRRGPWPPPGAVKAQDRDLKRLCCVEPAQRLDLNPKKAVPRFTELLMQPKIGGAVDGALPGLAYQGSLALVSTAAGLTDA